MLHTFTSSVWPFVRPGTSLVIVILALVLIAAVIISLHTGAMDISPVHAVQSYMSGQPDLASRVLVTIRLPRIVFGLMGGAALAVAGAVMQTLFRNDLVDPGIIGISSGAGFGVSLSIILGLASAYALPLSAFAGGVAAASAVYGLSVSRRRVSVSTLILAGVALNAIFGAGVGLINYLADDAQLRDITFWTMGSLGGIQWPFVAASAIPVIGSMIVVLTLWRPLNALQLGEREAGHLGISVERVKQIALLCAVMMVGSVVAFSGVIGFIGLVAPHISRKLVGSDNRVHLSASALFGAIVMIVADTVSRTIISPAELPIGIVAAILGGPFFLYLILKKRGE